MAVQNDSVFHRNWQKRPPEIDKGEGIYLYDVAGKRYLDGSGGPMVVNIGHGVKEITDAMTAQAERVSFPYAGHFTSQPQELLAKKVIEYAPQGMGRVYFVSGGSEATEVALKMARHYHLGRGEPSRVKVISRWQSYHGATMGALSLSGHTGRRSAYLPYMIDFPHIPPAYCYRCPYQKEHPACGTACAYELERAIKQEGQHSIAAFIAEPIVGNTLGCTVPPPDYFPIIREICNRYGILLIVDEVVTGFGRTGKNFGIDHWGVTPDIITTGKGIGSGYTPLGAVIVNDKVFDVFRESGRSTIFLGYTYAGNPLSCAIGLAVLNYSQKHGLVQRAMEMGSCLFGAAQRLKHLPAVGDIRGNGLLMGIELVRDKQKKTPFDRSLKVAETITNKAFENGLILLSGSGTADGVTGDHLILSPPFIIKEEQIEDLLNIAEKAIAETFESLKNSF